MRRCFYTLVALALTVSMVHANGPTSKSGAGKPGQVKPALNRGGATAPANAGFGGVAVANLPNGPTKPGIYGNLQGKPSNCAGVTVVVRKVFTPTVKRVIAVPVGQTPASNSAIDITGQVFGAAGAGRGVALGKLIAGAFTTSKATWLFVELEQVYVDYAFTYRCFCGRYDLVSVREVGRGRWTFYEQLTNRNLDNGPNWFGDETGADVAAAIAQALMKY